MKLNGLALRTLAVAALSLPLAGGCGSPAEPQEQSTPSAANSSPTSATDSTVSVIAEGVETEAAQSVAIFLDSLRKGDERAANGVLTTKARAELAKTTYGIQPLGSPEGQYKIGRVVFPYADKKVALVESTWTEPPTAGQPLDTMDIVCEVRQEQEGWRISGFGVTIPGSDETLVVDFEDAASLQATIDAATGQAPQPSNRVANAEAAPGEAAQSAGLPAYPSAGQPADTGAANAPFPQIALPPLDNAPLNR